MGNFNTLDTDVVKNFKFSRYIHIIASTIPNLHYLNSLDVLLEYCNTALINASVSASRVTTRVYSIGPYSYRCRHHV